MGQKSINLKIINANTLIEKLKFVDGVVPEEPLEGLEEGGGGVTDLGSDVGEREEGVLANVLGVGEGKGSGGVEVVGEGLLGYFDCFGSVLDWYFV